MELKDQLSLAAKEEAIEARERFESNIANI